MRSAASFIGSLFGFLGGVSLVLPNGVVLDRREARWPPHRPRGTASKRHRAVDRRRDAGGLTVRDGRVQVASDYLKPSGAKGLR